MNSAGRLNQAIDVLAAVYKRYANNRDLLYALATMNRDAGRIVVAQSYAEKLAALAPDDPDVLNVREHLQR